MHTRYYALQQWLKDVLNFNDLNITPLVGDASFRGYYRIHTPYQSYIVMDAPPSKEEITSFITVGKALANIGVHSPTICAYNSEQGFVLLEDLGDQLLLNNLSADNVEILYKAAMMTLLKMQECPSQAIPLPPFNEAFILQELSLFQEWFLNKYLQLQLSSLEEQILTETFSWLASNIGCQPKVFIHRDYHSRNLMIIENSQIIDLGVIDFQDAMHGPFTYDLVSLLKDCYIQWPQEDVLRWATDFYHLLPNNSNWPLPAFIQAFELCGLQRHLKVLGIFCRLHLRDHKSAYLKDLPLVFNYVMSSLETLSSLRPFYHFMQNRVQTPFFEKTR